MSYAFLIYFDKWEVSMAHWGWYWKVKEKHVKRVLCSTLARIDSFALYKGGVKENSIVGFTVQPLQVRAEAHPSHLKITYRNRKNHSYTISIEKLPCNYGGLRFFFKCPLCQKRMRFLYLGQQSVFLCRQCWCVYAYFYIGIFSVYMLTYTSANLT